MKLIYTTILFFCFILNGFSQAWEDENDVTHSVRFLDHKPTPIGGKKKTEKLFQRKIRFPIELKDTLSQLLKSNTIRVAVYIKVDTLGKTEVKGVWCNKYPPVADIVKKALITYLPDFTPPVLKSKKVRIDFYYTFILSTKEKIKELKPPDYDRFYIYPVFTKPRD